MDNTLEIKIVDGILIISTGIKSLAAAFECSPENYDTEKDESIYKASDITAFANSVVYELLDEEEDGTTLVHLMFDKAFNNALERGAQGISGGELIDEMW